MMCDLSANTKTQNTKEENLEVQKLAEEITKLEWDQFQLTQNEGGRANCQGNWPTFHIMRVSQFLA
ncbi:hypothetical protein HMPREF1584_01405, partial [Gardnerella vaginalis JCP8481A]